VFFLFLSFDNVWLGMLFRILLIPVIAGVSFELIAWAGNSEGALVAVFSRPGMWLQKLTTREPDDAMIEVAIASVEAVFDWKKYQEECRKIEERTARLKKTKKTQEKNPRRKTRSQQRKALKEREERYRNHVVERDRRLREQEEKAAAHEKLYQAAKKRKAERLAATQDLPKLPEEPVPAPKVEINSDEEDLKGLDHYFDKK
jgi:hypothetical protein